jgi:hypothetical protein
MIFPVFGVNGRRPFEQPVALAQVIITLLCNFSALLIIEKFDQFIGYLDANAFLRLFGGRTDMRRAENLLQLEEFMPVAGFFGEYIQGSPGNLSVYDRSIQSVFIDYSTPRAVNDVNA